MLRTIKKSSTKKDIDRLLQSIKSKRGLLDTSKYSGKLKLNESPIKIQKRLRDEWERISN